MKEALRLLFIVSLLLTLTTIVASSDGGNVNMSLSQTGVERRPLSRAELVRVIRQIAPEFSGRLSAGPISCHVRAPNGATPVTTVPASEYDDKAFWLYYASGGAGANKVIFIVMPLFEGSPLSAQIQVFSPGGSTTNIITPFGIPFWAEFATSGRWLLLVVNDLGHSVYSLFTDPYG